MFYTNLKVARLIEEELQILIAVMRGSGVSEQTIKKGVELWIQNKDFTIISLFDQSPKYTQGRKEYTKYFMQFLPDRTYDDLAVKKTFTDITSDKNFEAILTGVDALLTNTVTIKGDFSQIIENGDTHTIVRADESTVQFTVAAQGATYSSLTKSTTIYYTSLPIGSISTGDKLTFTKGLKLDGVLIDIDWYNEDGTVGSTKRVVKLFTQAKSSLHEEKRRNRSISNMIEATKGTVVEAQIPFVFEYLRNNDPDKDYIDEYIRLGRGKQLKNYIPTITDPDVNAVLDTVITVYDIDGNPITAPLRLLFLAEIYEQPGS